MRRRMVHTLLLGVAISTCFVLYSYNLDTFHAERDRIPTARLTETLHTADKFGVRNILNEKTDNVFENLIQKMLREYNTSVSLDSPVENKRMQALVIVAGFRTGSSFIGQMFNQHPNVFYLFEPLFFSKRQLIPELNARVLEDLLLCNMTTIQRETVRVWHEYRSSMQNASTKKGYGIDHCIDYGICFREKSRALCTSDMCEGQPRKYCRYCPRARLSDIEKKCREAQLRVIKVIRVSDISQLQRSWRNKDIDLKILHLVRDPRSTAISRYKLDRTSDTETLIGRTCEENAANHGHVIHKDEDYLWLRGIYKLIRYEDAIADPESFAREMYDFVDSPSLTLHPDVISWIRNSTTSTDRNSYSTRRDTQKQKHIWRKRITFLATLKVQSSCDVMMKMLGYKSVRSEDQLRNLNVTLLGKPKTVT